MGVVINCMGKGKEGSQTYMYIEIYTQPEGREKTMISTGTVYVPSELDSWKEHFRNKNIFEFDLLFTGEVTVEENSSWRVLWMK